MTKIRFIGGYLYTLLKNNNKKELHNMLLLVYLIILISFFFPGNSQKHLPSTTASILQILRHQISRRRMSYLIVLDVIYLTMHSKDTMLAYSHMDKQVHIQIICSLPKVDLYYIGQCKTDLLATDM